MHKSHFIIKFALFLILLATLSILEDQNLNHEFAQNESPLKDHWSISVNDESYNNTTLDTFHIGDLPVNSLVSLTHILPEETYDQTSVRMMLRYCTAQVYLDNKLIYETGQNYLKENKVLGSGYIWVPLPADHAGKEFRIELCTSEVNSFHSIDPITLTHSPLIYKWILANKLLTSVITGFLMLLGIICTFGILTMKLCDKRFGMLLWLGIFSISISLWMLCNTRLM